MSHAESDRHDEEDVLFSSPNGLKKLRACFRCHLVKTETQFFKEGCENCEFFKEYKFSLEEFTSANFEGIISVIDNKRSWISRYLNLEKFIPGCYALKIRSEFPERIEQFIGTNEIIFARNPE